MTYLRSKALQIMQHLLRPVSRKLIVSINIHWQVRIVSRFTVLEVSSDIEELVIGVIGIDRWEVSKGMPRTQYVDVYWISHYWSRNEKAGDKQRQITTL